MGNKLSGQTSIFTIPNRDGAAAKEHALEAAILANGSGTLSLADAGNYFLSALDHSVMNPSLGAIHAGSSFPLWGDFLVQPYAPHVPGGTRFDRGSSDRMSLFVSRRTGGGDPIGKPFGVERAAVVEPKERLEARMRDQFLEKHDRLTSIGESLEPGHESTSQDVGGYKLRISDENVVYNCGSAVPKHAVIAKDRMLSRGSDLYAQLLELRNKEQRALFQEGIRRKVRELAKQLKKDGVEMVDDVSTLLGSRDQRAEAFKPETELPPSAVDHRAIEMDLLKELRGATFKFPLVDCLTASCAPNVCVFLSLDKAEDGRPHGRMLRDRDVAISACVVALREIQPGETLSYLWTRPHEEWMLDNFARSPEKRLAHLNWTVTHRLSAPGEGDPAQPYKNSGFGYTLDRATLVKMRARKDGFKLHECPCEHCTRAAFEIRKRVDTRQWAATLPGDHVADASKLVSSVLSSVPINASRTITPLDSSVAGTVVLYSEEEFFHVAEVAEKLRGESLLQASLDRARTKKKFVSVQVECLSLAQAAKREFGIALDAYLWVRGHATRVLSDWAETDAAVRFGRPEVAPLLRAFLGAAIEGQARAAARFLKANAWIQIIRQRMGMGGQPPR